MRADYICKDCNQEFVFKKEYGEDFPTHPECPECKSLNTDRSFSSMTFHFGSGASYKNGYTSISNRRIA